jgi:hypothetical protein
VVEVLLEMGRRSNRDRQIFPAKVAKQLHTAL